MIRKIFMGLTVISLTGCASMSMSTVDGPAFKQVKQSIPQQDESDGRIYFYREDKMFGWAVRPEVKVNDEGVGTSQPGSVFIVDRKPGHYKIAIDSEIEFDLKAQETKYVRMEPGMGVIRWSVNPEIKDVPTVNLDDLKYLGKK